MKQFGKWIIIGSVIALAGSFFMKEKTSEFTRFIPGLSDKTSTFVQPDGSAGSAPSAPSTGGRPTPFEGNP